MKGGTSGSEGKADVASVASLRAQFEPRTAVPNVLDGGAQSRPIEEVLASIAKKGVAIDEIYDSKGRQAGVHASMEWDKTAVTNLMGAITVHNETAVPLKQVRVQDISALKKFLEPPERQMETSPVVEEVKSVTPKTKAQQLGVGPTEQDLQHAAAVQKAQKESSIGFSKE